MPRWWGSRCFRPCIKLDHGEEGEADVEIGGRTLRIRFDPLKKRVLMFELKKARTRNSRLRGPGTKTLH